MAQATDSRFKEYLKRVLKRFRVAIIIIVFTSGILLLVLSIRFSGYFGQILGNIGVFLAAVAAISFSYEWLIKQEEREIFMSDLDTLLDNKLRNIGSPLRVWESGRRTLDDLLSLLNSADSEIIAIGIALRSFTGYFFLRPADDFKNHVINLLKRRVSFKCLLLDPDWEFTKMLGKDLGENNLAQDIHHSIEQLNQLRDEFNSASLPGSFEIYVYSHIPQFHAVCIDPEKPEGRVSIAHYMHAIRTAEIPTIELTRLSMPVMFKKYWESLEELLKNSRHI